ncbi:MAG: NADH-quinone oxidoreductase subunit NuoF [Pseudomonadales bacterium]|jgi:NADH-quinone oxidoreductase subunit F|nr:NADH-quinone oxidoreductase subunit NuoF [Pseudomonadales bacterium]MCC6529244.1 NADH-quinone oxidoreductase subunit NuoF [Pseudomonadales bacterium]MCP5332578.1 NADH-quinone oxidoreductase subunit NuoF [Pseudomonadales bacterium]HMU89123.1 NADH-quinone oxidoreductase subunit NuoF [Pseudomonadales bacterium]HMW14034.1 NADH-quinone oxidoreductase subunit NuoF [Pseudomonadales bacterium]
MARSAETHPLTYRLESGEPVVDLKAYEALAGYAALRKAVPAMTPAEVAQVVKDANLRGRGGAGFPAGIKWGLVPMGADAPAQKYLVCNADEMEPGTFKDRLLMEKLPHQLIEGMIVAAYAIQASRGYIFLRGEYVLAAERLNRAIAQAIEAGYLGQNILGSGWSFDLFVHTGAGRYICGEETALINSLEGRRANPRSKPPFPQIAGLWGKPTVVNNCETLNNVAPIVLHGADWFKGLSQGKSPDGGTKLYGASGRVKRTGVWELPIGTTAREILEQHAGGMQDGLALKAWLPGGASTDFLLPSHLDLAMDFDTIMKAGSRMGTGLIMAIDDRQSMVSVVRNLEIFFARESCGWCSPCRDGLPWTVKILSALERGEGQAGEIEILEQIARQLGPGKTFCAHAPGAVEPLQSAIKFFREEFERGIAAPEAERA